MSTGSDLALLARITASLVVVVVLALLAARLARRASVRGPGVGLRVVDRAGLSRDAAVAVVEVAGRALVLGITAQKVTLLTQLDADALASRGDPTEWTVPGQPTGSVRPEVSTLWRHSVEALRDLTARR